MAVCTAAAVGAGGGNRYRKMCARPLYTTHSYSILYCVCAIFFPDGQWTVIRISYRTRERTHIFMKY